MSLLLADLEVAVVCDMFVTHALRYSSKVIWLIFVSQRLPDAKAIAVK